MYWKPNGHGEGKCVSAETYTCNKRWVDSKEQYNRKQ